MGKRRHSLAETIRDRAEERHERDAEILANSQRRLWESRATLRQTAAKVVGPIGIKIG